MGNIMGIYLLLSLAVRAYSTGWAAGLCCLSAHSDLSCPVAAAMEKKEKKAPRRAL